MLLAAGEDDKTILTLNLPAGSYAITASITVLASDIAPAPAALVFCGLGGGNAGYASSSTQTVLGRNTSGEVTIPLIGARSLASSGQLSVSCIARPLNVPVPPTQKLVQVRAALLAQAVNPLTSEEPVSP